MEGLRGDGSAGKEAKVTDEDTAHAAGSYQGFQKRKEAIEKDCNGDASKFDDWLKEHGSEVEGEARQNFRDMISQTLWIAKAKEYKKGFTSLAKTDFQILEDQYYAWVYIIGSSPASKGGSWLKLWTDNRLLCADEPDRSAGVW